MSEPLESIFNHTPVGKEMQDRMIEITRKTEFKLVILNKLLVILSKQPNSIEEAAMLFHEAKPLAKTLTDSFSK